MNFLTFWCIIYTLSCVAKVVNCSHCNCNESNSTVLGVHSATEHVPLVILHCTSQVESFHRLEELPDLVNGSCKTEILLCSDQIMLSSKISFSNLYNLSIHGFTDTVIDCSSSNNSGLEFRNINILTLTNVTFHKCGFKHSRNRVTTFDIYRDAESSSNDVYTSGILIENCSNVNLSYITIDGSPGTGLSLYNNVGRLSVLSSTFLNNGHDKNDNGDRGIYAELTYSDPSRINPDSCSIQQEDSVYSFYNCTFRNNTAYAESTAPVTQNIFFNRKGSGGGLCIYVIGNENRSLERNLVNISHCTFEKNEADRWAGGIFVSMHGFTVDNRVVIQNSNFTNNKAREGGASYVGYLRVNDDSPANNSYMIESCYFLNNLATYGGGTAFYSSRKINQVSQNSVTFYNCTWKGNKALFGSAINILPNSWDLLSVGYLPAPVFHNCTIESNYVLNMIDEELSHPFSLYSKGVGALYVSDYKIIIQGALNFEKNNGSAMFLSTCFLDFSINSTIRFISNTGYYGGGIFLTGDSVIFVRDNAQLYFIQNKAVGKGGAIYYYFANRHDYSYSRSCFLQYIGKKDVVSERNIKFYFYNNEAGAGNSLLNDGHSIYASSFLPCSSLFTRWQYYDSRNDSRYLVIADIDILSHIATFNISNTIREKEFGSAQNRFVVDTDTTDSVRFIPGKHQELPFQSYDDFNQTVNNAYLLTIDEEGNTNIQLESAYFDYVDKGIKLFGDPGDRARLILSTFHSRRIAMSIEIELRQCPPGYVLSEQLNMKRCLCSVGLPEKYVGIQYCNGTLFQAYRQRGFWINYESQNQNETESTQTLLSGICPRGYCSFHDDSLQLPPIASKEMLNDVVCAESRTGTLCGKCSESHSAYYHSPFYRCGTSDRCHLGWLFYILSEIIPVTLLFIVVILFNIPFTSGAIFGFIFFAQVIEIIESADDFIVLPHSVYILTKICHFIYLMFNLNFFAIDELSFCLWKNATVLQILCFNYLTIVYSFVLVILTVVIMNVCSLKRVCRCLKFRDKNNFGTSIIHGLSAFLILCYAQCARISLLILASAQLYSRGGIIHRTVAYYDGEFTWFQGGHLYYAIPAIFFIIIIVFIPPILLIVYPLCYKIFSFLRISESRFVYITCKVIPLERLKPFLDSFQSCFKDQFRFFAGLYFVYRFFILINFAISRPIVFYPLLQLQLILMFIIHSIAQPYKKRYHNILDSFIIGNLAIINGISMFNFNAFQSTVGTKNVIDGTNTFQLVLIFLPLVYVIILITFPFVKRVAVVCFKKPKSAKPLDDGEIPERISTDSDSDNEMFELQDYQYLHH